MAYLMEEAYADDFTAQVLAGARAELVIALLERDGVTYEALTGRTFEQRIFERATGVVYATIAGVIDIDGEGVPIVRFALSETETDALLPTGAAARDLAHAVVETTDDAEIDLIEPTRAPVFRIRRGSRP